MASRRGLAGPAAVPDIPVSDRYVQSLSSRLSGPARARARILDEIRGELDDATQANLARHLPVDAAVRAAVDDLGSPATVAAAFAGELGILRARRVLWTLLLTGPLVGIWWLLLLTPSPWTPRLGIVLAAIPVLPPIAAAVGTRIVVIAATGSLIRWLPEAAPKRALAAAIAVALVSILGDLSVLTILVVRGVMGSAGAFPLALVMVAVLASTIRLVGSMWAVRRCLHARRVLVAPN
jgi:hypothetical protein